MIAWIIDGGKGMLLFVDEENGMVAQCGSPSAHWQVDEERKVSLYLSRARSEDATAAPEISASGTKMQAPTAANRLDSISFASRFHLSYRTYRNKRTIPKRSCSGGRHDGSYLNEGKLLMDQCDGLLLHYLLCSEVRTYSLSLSFVFHTCDSRVHHAYAATPSLYSERSG